MEKLVCIEKCSQYNNQEMEQKIYKSIDSVLPAKENLRDKKILVKVNLLMKSKPEEAITTHPLIVRNVVNYFLGLGCKVIIGDSPGGPYTKSMLQSVYKETGMEAVANATGCELNYDTSVINVKITGGKVLHNVDLIKIVKDVDYVVSVPKLKTHAMMTYTGAVKNNFGVIAGLMKRACHFNMKNTENFSDLLVDICQYIKPLVTVMDAIECMEGDGPSGGKIRHAGLILTSADPYALDTLASHIIGLNPLSVPTIKTACERGLDSGRIEDIQIKGEKLSGINIRPFLLPNTVGVNSLGTFIPDSIKDYLVKKFRATPNIIHKKCKKCKKCVNVCPAQVMKVKDGKVTIQRDTCICCYCCHELCPENAIQIKKSWIRKLLIG